MKKSASESLHLLLLDFLLILLIFYLPDFKFSTPLNINLLSKELLKMLLKMKEFQHFIKDLELNLYSPPCTPCFIYLSMITLENSMESSLISETKKVNHQKIIFTH
jgi:hypothetical protein